MQKYIPLKQYKASWQFADLKGKVKKITTYEYHINKDSTNTIRLHNSKDSVLKNLQLASIIAINFNYNGLKTEELHQVYTLPNLIYGEYEESFNGEEGFIPQIHIVKDITKANDFTSKLSFEYDNFNRLVKVKSINNNNETLHAADFVYNDQHDLIKTRFWGYKSSLTDEYNNYYDKKDSLIMIEHHNYKASEFAIQKLKYYSPNKSYSAIYLLDNKLYTESFYYKDEDGLKTKLQTWTKNTRCAKCEKYFKLDKYGNTIEFTIKNNKGEVTTSKIATYDYLQNTNLIKVMRYTNTLKNKETTFEFEYNFDKLKNLKEEKIYCNTKLFKVIKTVFEYYE